jgi:hypothetical protein
LAEDDVAVSMNVYVPDRAELLVSPNGLVND